MSISQFPKHIVDELPQLLPYLEEYISGIASTFHISTPSSNLEFPAQILALVPKELLYLIPYLEKVDQDHIWLLPYYKDFAFDDTSTSYNAASLAYQHCDRVHHNSSTAEDDFSSDDDSSDNSYDSSDSEDEFYDCNTEFGIGCVIKKKIVFLKIYKF